ncbi:MAG: hemerythrin domain-containing protein [Methanobacteriota archaeon]
MKSTAILELMVKDHGKLVQLLSDVEKSVGAQTLTVMKVFDSFQWALEKHFFTEEKAIFTSYNPVNIQVGYRMVPELIKEHNKILNSLEVMRRDLLKQRRCDFEDFRELLMNHKVFEEQQLYPKLDQELSDEQRNEIIRRVEEMV